MTGNQATPSCATALLRYCARASRAWNSFWFRPVPPHALGVFRILVGVFLIIFTLQNLPYVPERYSSAGVHLPFAFPPEGSITSARDLLGFLLQPLPPSAAWTLYFLYLFSLLCFTMGFFTRAATLISLLFYAYYYFLFSHIVDGSFDHINPLLLLVLLFSGAGKAYSVDTWRTEGRWVSRDRICVFAQRLLCVQLSFSYMSIGLVRIVKGGWESGIVLEQSFTSVWATPPAYALIDLADALNIGGRMWLLDLLVIGVKVLEVGLPIGLWMRELRVPSVIVGILFHVGISVLLTMWMFFAMPAVYLLYFNPEAVAGRLKSLRFLQPLHNHRKT